MSVCAGSSTEWVPGRLARTRTRRFTSCAPRNSPVLKRFSFKHYAGQVRMDRRPGRIGFMSTQRRENRWRRTSCFAGAGLSGIPGGGLLPLGWRPSGIAFPGLIARRNRTDANGGTAPPVSLAWFHPSDKNSSPGASAWLATNSLPSGTRIVQLVLQDPRHGTPPFGAGPGAASGTPANLGAPLPRISPPSASARLHPALPRVPAGIRRWAERYDGKRNLHLQHAA